MTASYFRGQQVSCQVSLSTLEPLQCFPLSLVFVLAALIAYKLTPNFPNDNSGQGIYCSFFQQAVTNRNRNFYKRTFPCVTVQLDVSIKLINYQTSAFFVEILYANETKTLLFSVLLKSKLYKIKRKTFLCIFIWYCMSSCSNGSPLTTVKAELQFVPLRCNGAKKIINYFSCLKYIIWLRL